VPGNIYKERFGANLDMATNELVIRIQPKEAIYLKISNKVRKQCQLLEWGLVAVTFFGSSVVAGQGQVRTIASAFHLNIGCQASASFLRAYVQLLVNNSQPLQHCCLYSRLSCRAARTWVGCCIITLDDAPVDSSW
jgi:hypothetical protein